MKNKGSEHNKDECKKARMAVKDTLDILGGKWKLVIISMLRFGKMRFKELSREAGISPRILSKELKELEMNGLVSRTVKDTRPVTVEYALTPYSDGLEELVNAMYKWGINHRKKVTGKE
ncbi:winged helix-turn-helix transcriptional regulator [Tenacibaculum singaporense]|uniref:winged helix-turn-helix transcriptional regulator n=1 Tax=Tenacibaculum singaporense TaxID=2358479 RepID=UPI000F685122|nr:helix-turn-helix domain-containing protein [Tenacibaculum singaporense]RSC93475.1 transcriptional regulator [Tenacibaculum singaporense]